MLEDARAEVCFKTGLAGFQITMLFFTLTELMISNFNKDWKSFEDTVDNNYGCLPLAVEDELQIKFKKI